MTIVNQSTGEIIAPLNDQEAQRLTMRIRLRLDTIADNYVAVMPLIREAVERRAWESLGYSGVSSYVSECFGDALTKLSVDVRRVVVAELSAAGMSTRAIAPVVGTSHMTVSTDLAGVKGFTPDGPPAASIGSAGGSLVQPQEPTAPATALTSVEPGTAPEQVEPPASAGAARTITGLDGKTYRPVDHEARARVAVERYPDLSWQFEQRDFEHCWRTADKLDEFAERGQLEERLENLRRYNAVEKAKQDGTYVPPAASAICPTCGQTRKANP